jgi:Na+-translocating ferredoxin:NAD+ oxidoreductase RnfD subunit
MTAHAAPAPGGLSLTIRGRTYPVLLPRLKDPRLHLAATITSLQVIGQIGFHFRVSIAQILVSLLTCAVLEVGIAVRRQGVLLWPASALLTGNGVAFVLRVPGTEHGDWWTLRGWWIYMATAAVALLSKHLIQWRGQHIFNPSNIGLVLCFVLLGRAHAEPLDFWWGPTSPWLALALAIILAGGFTILSRLKLLWIALTFWGSFALGIGLLALTGHAMTARWHLGPITGFQFFWVLVTSPEVLVFLFFMITDPKTAPTGARARIAYALSLGFLGALLIAPMRTEYWSKVGLLASLAIVCAAMPIVRLVSWQRLPRRRLVLAGVGALAAYAAGVVVLGLPARLDAQAARPLPAGKLPPVSIEPSRGVQSQLDQRTAELIAHDLVSVVPARAGDRVHLWLEPGGGQNPPVAVAQLAGRTYRLRQSAAHWTLKPVAAPTRPQVQASGPALPGFALSDVAAQVGIDFEQGSFRYGLTNDNQAMMGGGVCWIDYNSDGWLDLFVVNGYTDDNVPAWQEHGGLPTTALYRNDHGTFTDVSKSAGAALPLRGEGCVAADLDGDGQTDLYVTTSTNDALLWNNGDGTFTEGARKAGVVSFGWHAGAAVSDVNGDGRPDLFVAGYTDMTHALPSSTEGFPGNYAGVHDELFLNRGNRRFEEVAARTGLDPAADHGLGAVFTDANHDGRPDLYVANDEDPNRLYLNEAGGPLGFHFVDAARAEGVADTNAGMGIAEADYDGDGLSDFFVSNSRGQTHAAYRGAADGFRDVRKQFTAALGPNDTGWGDAWVDLNNDGRLDLVLANGALPVTNLEKDAGFVQALAQGASGSFTDARVLRGLRANGRGVAAADYDNDGRVDLAVNTIGGRLLLLHNDGAVAHWLTVRLDPAAPGAVVTLVLADGRRVVRETHAGSSYLSSEDPRVHFGLGAATSFRSVTVRFPDGTTQTVHGGAANRIVTVTP